MDLSSLILGTGPTKVLNPQGGCSTCPRKREGFVPATKVDSQLIIVDNAPGESDVTEGRILAGEAGALLRGELHAAGIQNYSVTAAIHCRPTSKGATGKELQCCLNQYVLEEIRGYPVVVLLGGNPASALFPGMQYFHLEGNVARHPDFPGQAFYTMRHPDAVLRNTDTRKTLVAQIQRLSRILQDPGKISFRLIRATDGIFEEKLREALAGRRLSIDLETAGEGESPLKPWDPRGRIKSLALASNIHEALFVSETDAVFERVLEQIADWLQVESHQVVGKHVGFDLKWIESRTSKHVRAKYIFDIGVLFYQLKGYQQMSLKELVAKELDGYRYLVYQPHKEQNLEILGYYNGEDVVYPLQMFLEGFPKLRPRTRELFMRVGGPSDLALMRMTHNGMDFDLEYWAKSEASVREEMEQALIRWREQDPDFNPNVHLSGNGLKAYLFEIKKLPVVKTTGKGAASTDEESVKIWIRDHGASYLENFVTYQKMEKLRSTYVEPLANKHLDPVDKRIHPSYHNTSTDTGRSSSSDPNAQNQPRGPLIRGCFVPPEGWVMVQGDFSQIELRIGVSLANEQNGIRAYLSGKDMHALTASYMSKMRGTGPDGWDKEDRNRAKPVNFGLWYGGSAEGLQSYAATTYGINLTLEECKQFVTAFFNDWYPAMEAYFQATRQEMIANKGWLESVVGHVHYYEHWNSDNQGAAAHAYRSYLNSKCQGPAGYIGLYTVDLAERALLDLGAEGKIKLTPGVDGRTNGSVHDSVLVRCPADEVDATIEVMRESVKEVEQWCSSWLKVPLVMDFETGPRWSELKPYTKAA